MLFSDVPKNTIQSWSALGGIQPLIFPPGYTHSVPRRGELGLNGLVIDTDGKLLICQHGDRRIAKLTSDFGDNQPQFETIVWSYKDIKFNSPNDLAIDASVNTYFTDPPY